MAGATIAAMAAGMAKNGNNCNNTGANYIVLIFLFVGGLVALFCGIKEIIETYGIYNWVTKGCFRSFIEESLTGVCWIFAGGVLIIIPILWIIFK